MSFPSPVHSTEVAPPLPSACTRTLNMLCSRFIYILLSVHVALGTPPPPTNIHLPTSSEFTSLQLPIWSNLRRLLKEMERGVINITTPHTPALLAQLRKEAKELKAFFPSSRSPRSIWSFFGIASENQLLHDELQITDIAAAQRSMQSYVNTYDSIFKSLKNAVLAEEAEVKDILNIQTALLRSVGAAALTENIRHLTLLFREVNKLAVTGTTGTSPSDVLRLPPFSYLSGIHSNATTVTLHLLVPVYELQMCPVCVSQSNFKCYAKHDGFFISLESCSDSHVNPLALSFRVLPQKLHPNTLRLRPNQIECIKSQHVGQLVKYCSLDENVSVGFNTSIIGNHTESFQALQTNNLTSFYGSQFESQAEAVIANLKSLSIPSPVHWTTHFLHPWMTPAALLLASLALLMHFKNYFDQFKTNKRVRMELERMEGMAS